MHGLSLKSVRSSVSTSSHSSRIAPLRACVCFKPKYRTYLMSARFLRRVTMPWSVSGLFDSSKWRRDLSFPNDLDRVSILCAFRPQFSKNIMFGMVSSKNFPSASTSPGVNYWSIMATALSRCFSNAFSVAMKTASDFRLSVIEGHSLPVKSSSYS